jgi:hypothetical protein
VSRLDLGAEHVEVPSLMPAARPGLGDLGPQAGEPRVAFLQKAQARPDDLGGRTVA